jgi:hypothetical protein
MLRMMQGVCEVVVVETCSIPCHGDDGKGVINEGKRPLGDLDADGKNAKFHLKEIGCEGLVSIQLQRMLNKQDSVSHKN